MPCGWGGNCRSGEGHRPVIYWCMGSGRDHPRPPTYAGNACMAYCFCRIIILYCSTLIPSLLLTVCYVRCSADCSLHQANVQRVRVVFLICYFLVDYIGSQHSHWLHSSIAIAWWAASGVPSSTPKNCMGVLCTWVKLLADLQILGCELHKNAFGGRPPPGPAGEL